jgi:hypothetical protein
MSSSLLLLLLLQVAWHGVLVQCWGLQLPLLHTSLCCGHHHLLL